MDCLELGLRHCSLAMWDWCWLKVDLRHLLSVCLEVSGWKDLAYLVLDWQSHGRNKKHYVAWLVQVTAGRGVMNDQEQTQNVSGRVQEAGLGFQHACSDRD